MHSEHSQQSQGQRRFIIIAALLGWSALAIQLYLIFFARWADQASLLGGLVRFFSFFTILTNTLVASALTCAVVRRSDGVHRFFRTPWVCSGIAASIVLVGLAYNVLLRHLWQPQGWQWIADELLHDIMPLLFLVYWWLYVQKGVLRLSHVLLWAIYPLVYFAYVLLRGDLIGDYMYPFIDVGTLGYAKAFINAGGVLAGFFMVSLVLVGLDRVKGRNARG